MSVRDNLIAAKALIDTPEKWGKHDFFDGSCYCTAGAVREVLGAWRGTDEWAALCSAMPEGLEGYSPVWLNDIHTTTHADIMALFDRAIASSSLNGETE